MAQGESVLADLVDVRQAAVKLTDVIEDCGQADGLLPPRSTAAWGACYQTGDALMYLDDALSKLVRYFPAQNRYSPYFRLPDPKETSDSHRACTLLHEASFELSEAGFEASYDADDAVPVKVDAATIKKLKLGIKLLTSFVPGRTDEGSNLDAKLPGTSTEEGEDIGALEHALALLVKHPKWSDTKIAKTVGVARTTLYKPTWKKYQTAREALKGGKCDIPRGSKDENGNIEAWDGDTSGDTDD